MQINGLLSRYGMTVILLVVALPVLLPMMKKVESAYFPVVIDVLVRTTDMQGCPRCQNQFIEVVASFNKVRDCPPVALAWYDNDGPNKRLLRTKFLDQNIESTDAENMINRELGPQRSRAWRIYGISSLEGTRATVEHQCHILYKTRTIFYN